MASRPETAQAAQVGLTVKMAGDLDRAWHILNPADIESTLPRFKMVIAALARKYGSASSALAARFYADQRREAEVFGRFTVRPADPAGLAQVESVIEWSTRPMRTAAADIVSARTQTVGAVEKMVLDVGRQTVVDTVHVDPKARGWARITKPGCCYWCAMLATRGAVYKTKDTAGFKAHDHDKCIPEPVFTAYEPSAQIRQWQADWQRVTAGAKDPVLAWRQHFENRSPVATSPTPGGSA